MFEMAATFKSRPIPERVAKRAATKYTVDSNGCHISTYTPTREGYAHIGWWDTEAGRSRMTTAQRAAWTHAHGPIPAGLSVDHICHVQLCVNVEHLRLLTLEENGRDGSAHRRIHFNPQKRERVPAKTPVLPSDVATLLSRAAS